MDKVTLTAKLIEAFAGVFLSPRYDNLAPTPQFHRECWELYCSNESRVAIAAPREHAKSTTLTFDYILAAVCFRAADYVIIIGSSEPKAQEHLSNIYEELAYNQDLRVQFGIVEFEVEQKTEIIVKCDDGHRFRILARGAEQKIRGSIWNGKRPNLIVCDDMEDDEQVESPERRRKFRNWFFRAAVQSLSTTGKIRVHGTILHESSLLSHLMKNRVWKHLFYTAHASYTDFSNILWPEKWSEERLRLRQREFEDANDAAGYSQEFLNNPLGHADAYLRSEDFIPMSEDDYTAKKRFVIGCDFAVSKKDLANRTSFTVGGQDYNNIIHIVDQRVGRYSTDEWIDLLFDLDSEYDPEFFVVEDGVIWKSVYPMIETEMRRRDHWIIFKPMLPTKDKAARGRSLQKRMRGHGVHFDKTALWYGGYEDELLRFTGTSQATLDDQFDSTVYVSLGFDKIIENTEDDPTAEEEEEFEEYSRKVASAGYGRNAITGY